MPISDQHSWDSAYDTISKKFAGVTEQINKRILRLFRFQEIISKDKTILDVGCGDGSFLLLLANLDYKNLDGFDNREYTPPILR